MKVKRIKKLLLVPFILIYFVLFVFNLVYDINLVYSVYTVFLWFLFLIYAVIQKRERGGNDYFTILMFVVTLILLIVNIIRRI